MFGYSTTYPKAAFRTNFIGGRILLAESVRVGHTVYTPQSTSYYLTALLATHLVVSNDAVEDIIVLTSND